MSGVELPFLSSASWCFFGSGRPPPNLDVFDGFFRSTPPGLFFLPWSFRRRPDPPELGCFLPGFSAPDPPSLPWFFRASPDPAEPPWFLGCRAPYPFMVFSRLPDFRELARIPAGFSDRLPKGLRWFFRLPESRCRVLEKVAKFPAVFAGLFGRSAGWGGPGPGAFHGFFGLLESPPDRPILANFSADFRPAQPSSIRFFADFQGCFDC